MIDEKKLIEEIKNLTMYITGLRAGKGVLSEFAKHYKESVLRIIDEQPKTDWIPCTVVNHPEHCNDCEVTIKDTIGYFRDIAYYTDKWRRLADETPVNVIAWKEPSRPYKKEGAE